MKWDNHYIDQLESERIHLTPGPPRLPIIFTLSNDDHDNRSNRHHHLDNHACKHHQDYHDQLDHHDDYNNYKYNRHNICCYYVQNHRQHLVQDLMHSWVIEWQSILHKVLLLQAGQQCLMIILSSLWKTSYILKQHSINKIKSLCEAISKCSQEIGTQSYVVSADGWNIWIVNFEFRLRSLLMFVELRKWQISAGIHHSAVNYNQITLSSMMTMMMMMKCRQRWWWWWWSSSVSSSK